MIVYDGIQGYPKPGWSRFMHLWSNIDGPDGEQELLQFGDKIGLKAKWLQHKGGPLVHFDVKGSMIDKAIQAGARQLTKPGIKELLVRRYKQEGIARQAREG